MGGFGSRSTFSIVTVSFSCSLGQSSRGESPGILRSSSAMTDWSRGRTEAGTRPAERRAIRAEANFIARVAREA